MLEKFDFYINNSHFQSRFDARDDTFTSEVFVASNMTLFMSLLKIFDFKIRQSLKIRSNPNRSSAYLQPTNKSGLTDICPRAGWFDGRFRRNSHGHNCRKCRSRVESHARGARPFRVRIAAQVSESYGE